MKNWKAALVFLCIFVAGGIAGGFVGLRVGCERGVTAAEIQKKNQQRPRRPVEEHFKRRLNDFRKRLNITEEQQAKIEPLFQSSQTEFRRLREQFFQETQEQLDKLDAQVMDVLTNEQKVEFARMIQERKEQQQKADAERAAARERGARPGGPPPPPSGGPRMPAGPVGDKAGQMPVPPPPPPAQD